MLDISNARFAFLDIETTGLSPWFGDRICQIAVVLTEGKRIQTTLDLILNPEHEISPAAFHINKLNEEKISAAPYFKDVTKQLEALLNDAIIVCHNAQFDLQFLDNEYHKLGLRAEYPNLIDTLVLAREYFELPSYTLSYLAEAFSLSNRLQTSRAMSDALSAKNIFFAMIDALKPNGKPLDDYIGIYNSPAWPQEGVYLPTELSEAIYSGKRLFIKYMDKSGEISERWISPQEVIGLADYIYLRAFCHTRNAERTFRLDRIIEVAVEVGKG
jgi:DNA polymerase III epsilon subunit family exonuclease